VRDKYDLGAGPLVLALGTIQPRKNYVRLIQAFGKVIGQWWQVRPETLGDVNLVIAGGKGWMFDDIFAEVKRLNLDGRVRFTGFIDDADLPALYSAATVFAYVSLYEGFGLPALEAMACGTPVIGSSLSSIPEVIGDAGLLVDPADVDAMAAGLIGLLKDASARDAFLREGLQRAARFTWEAAARQLLATYDKIGATRT